MGKIRIVSDSAADVLELSGVEFAGTPLKIITSDREFIDDAALDTQEMIDYFDEYKGKSKTSCPGPSDWIKAFGDADTVFCVTITSGLSGSYNSACVAKQIYESEASGRRVCIIDSLSAGPEMRLILEKLAEMVSQQMEYDEICSRIQEYKANTGLLFMLESLKNFAANGRVSPAVAKITGLLGIRIVGKASDKGQLEPLNKCRGEAGSLKTILAHLKEMGLSAGKVRIAHCRNIAAAEKLRDMILQAMPSVEILIYECRGLCSYYAEKGGMLVGFEKK